MPYPANPASSFPQQQNHAIVVLDRAVEWVSRWSQAPLNAAGRAYVDQVRRAAEKVPYTFHRPAASGTDLETDVQQLERLLDSAPTPPSHCLTGTDGGPRASVQPARRRVPDLVWVTLACCALLLGAVLFS